jgi:hypothetical protein
MAQDKRGAALLALLLVGGGALVLGSKGGGDANLPPPGPPYPPPQPPLPPPPPPAGAPAPPVGQVMQPQVQHASETDYGVLVTFAPLADGTIGATWLTPDGRTAPPRSSWPTLDGAEAGAMKLIGAQYNQAPWPLPGDAPHAPPLQATTKGRRY